MAKYIKCLSIGIIEQPKIYEDFKKLCDQHVKLGKIISKVGYVPVYPFKNIQFGDNENVMIVKLVKQLETADVIYVSKEYKQGSISKFILDYAVKLGMPVVSRIILKDVDEAELQKNP